MTSQIEIDIDRISKQNQKWNVSGNTSSSHQNDLSKSLQEFRNLEFSFMMDNGYLLFDLTTKKSQNKIESDMIIKIINSSLKTNLSSSFPDLGQITNQDLEDMIKMVSGIKKGQKQKILDTYDIVVGVAVSDTSLRFTPGYHHICNRQTNEDKTSDQYLYDMIIKRDQIVYFHPYIFYNLCNNEINNHNTTKLMWYGVKKGLSESDQKSVSLWGSWNLFKTKGDFTIIDDVKNHNLFQKDQELYEQFIRMEQKGYGEFVKLNTDNIVFRIRPVCNTGYIELGDPSIYESVIEIVYYFDISERILHTNYSDVDRFEVRTGGVLARSCNSHFTQKLYDLCCESDNDKSGDEDEFVFKFNLLRVIEFFRTMDYNKLLCEWYPRETKCDESIINNENSDVLVIGLPKNNKSNTPQTILDVKLNIKQVYSINVYKFDRLDNKNIARIRMIQSWMHELNLKGGFVISNETEHGTHDHNNSKSGYMIVAGEEVVITHRNKLGDLAIFQNRFKCLHWKKVKHYHYSNHDHIYRLRYEKFPNENFILVHKDLDKDPYYAEVLSVTKNI